MYTVVFGDISGRTQGVYDVWNLTWAAGYNRPGWFSLSGLPTEAADAMTEGGRVKVLRQGAVVLTGRIVWWEETMGSSSCGGGGDLGILTGRLALPEVHGDFGAQDYDVRTGPAETVIKGLVQDNASQAAPIAARRMDFVVETDGGRGGEVTVRARFHTLWDDVQKAAAAGGVGMRLVDGVFSVYVPAATPVATFGRGLGNLNDYTLRGRAPGGNYGYGGGQGEGTARTVVEYLDPQSVLAYGRREFFVDRRDTNDADEIRQEIKAQIDELPGGTMLTAEVSGVTPWEDVQPGDMVRVLLPRGRQVEARVQEMRVTWQGGKESVALAVGEGLQPDSPTAGLVQVMRRLGRRINMLEVV